MSLNTNMPGDNANGNFWPLEAVILSAEQRKQDIEKRLAERQQLRSQIMTLSKQRADFIAAERKKSGRQDNGFDAAVSAALKEQLKRKGIK